MGGYSRLEGPSTDRAYPNMIEEVRFAPDSALEGAVYCELVSEVQKLGADSGRVMDDSGIVKRCFPHEFGRKLYPPPRGVTPPSGYKSL